MTTGVQIPAERAGLTREQSIWRWRILISTYAGYAGFYLTRKVFTICKKPIAEEFGWSLSSVAHIWTVFLVAYMVGQFINSYFGRRHGPRVLLLGGLGLSILCNIVFGFSNSYYTLLVFMLFNGLFQAAGWPGSVGAISHWLRRFERGTIMGIWSTNYQIGNLAVKGLGGYLLGLSFALGSNGLIVHGWRLSFFGCTLVACAIWWLLYAWQRNRPEDVGLPPIVVDDGVGSHSIKSSQEDQISLAEYFRLALNPIILIMGFSYFCVKFSRYLLDSWLPAFLKIQGLTASSASYYSGIFDIAGLGGAVLAGFLVDRVLKGKWAHVCFIMAIGGICGNLLVMNFGTNPRALAICFGFVGLMVYGPDTLLSGVAAIQVAGEKNGVAIAGIVNGIASLGPVVQEEVISWLMRGDETEGIRKTIHVMLYMSIVFACFMLVVMWRLSVVNRARSIESARQAADNDPRQGT